MIAYESSQLATPYVGVVDLLTVILLGIAVRAVHGAITSHFTNVTLDLLRAVLIGTRILALFWEFRWKTHSDKQAKHVAWVSDLLALCLYIVWFGYPA